MVNIAVRDTGSGLDQEKMTELSDPERARASGPGPGLVICRGIVEAHGGTISARGRDRGMCIAFTLPRG